VSTRMAWRVRALLVAAVAFAPAFVHAQRGGRDTAPRNGCPATDSGKFERMAGDARALADAAASHVDTILVEPRSMQLTLHDSVSLTGFVEVFALDKAGQSVASFSALFTTPSDGIICLRRGYVIASKAGRTVLTVSAAHLRTNPRVTDARPGTRVAITVLP
jgi:hypothetical protein